MNNSEKEVKTEADSSSSDHPCPLALVTASNVRKPTQVFVLFSLLLILQKKMMVTDLCQSKILNLLMPYADLQLCAFIIHVKKI